MARKKTVKTKLQKVTSMLEGNTVQIRKVSLEEAKANLRRCDPGFDIGSTLPLINKGHSKDGMLLFAMENFAFPLIRFVLSKNPSGKK